MRSSRDSTRRYAEHLRRVRAQRQQAFRNWSQNTDADGAVRVGEVAVEVDDDRFGTGPALVLEFFRGASCELEPDAARKIARALMAGAIKLTALRHKPRKRKQ
jgi:hypothetical protein